MHFRYGWRGLRREPLFALTAVAIIAIGTAATTTVFSVVDAELWRPLPYADPDRLLAVGSRDPKTNAADGITIGELQAWRQRVTVLQSLAAVGRLRRQTAQLGSAESFRTTEVTSSYFTTLGRHALIGRVFSADDPPGTSGVVMTERAWARVFQRDPNILGRTFLLDDQQVTIVGVIANDDSMGLDGDLYVAFDERGAAPTAGAFYTMIGRLAPGASAAVVIDQLQTVIGDPATTDSSRRDHRAVAEDLSSYYRTTNARPLYFFLGASIVVLILTIANAAGLMVSRAVRRTPEFAVRSAIGGGSRTLAAQLVAESALIAVPGCVLGLLLANATLGVLGQFVPDDFLYRGKAVAIDARAVAGTLVIVVLTTAGLALVPLMIIRRIGERAAFGTGHRSTDTPLAAQLRRVIVAGQLALTVTLLAGAGVFVKSFVELTQVPLGFDPANVWSLRMTLSGPRFASNDAVRAYIDAIAEKLKAAPGVLRVSAATSSPLNSGFLALVAPSPSTAVETTGTRSIFRSVGPEYFAATGTPTVRGRAFTRDDRDGAPLVAVVNQTFVQQVFGGADPIGQRVDFLGMRAPIVGRGTATIVGVIANVKEISLNEVDMADLYVPFAQRPSPSVEFLVRGRGADPGMSTTLRAAAADPLVPVTNVSRLDTRVARAVSRERFFLIVVVVFAVLAVLTAAIGIYGSMAYAVSARWREFGVRLALGASPRALVRHTLGHAAALGLIGGGIGLVLALLLARWIGDALYLVPGSHNGLLYNTSTTDPLALGGALIAVLMLSLIAATVPARRASSVNPVQALRAD